MGHSNLIAITDRMRRARIEAAKMNLRERRVFEMYVALGEYRSLEALLEQCQEAGIVISLGGLKKWSVKFGWAALIQQIEEDVSAELGRRLLPDHMERVRGDLARIQRLKLKFYERVDRDDVEMTIDDFIKLCKLEQQLLHNPLERADEVTGNVKFEVELSPDELAVALKYSAAKRHNLPPPRPVEPKAIEAPANDG